jgi:hypothetical protein
MQNRMTEPANDNVIQQWENCSDIDCWDNVGHLCVSTVYRGPTKFPYSFETLIYNLDTQETVGFLRRYTTWKKAEAGHCAALQWAKHNQP